MRDIRIAAVQFEAYDADIDHDTIEPGNAMVIDPSPRSSSLRWYNGRNEEGFQTV